MTYNFNSRETYIVAATQWKKDYAELSQKIRDTRKEFKLAQQVFQVFSGIKFGSTYWPVQDLRSKLSALSYEAYTMVNLRLNMKEEAQVQYVAQQNQRSTCDYLN